MSDKKYWLSAGLFSFLQRFSMLIFGFGGFAVLVRVLPQDQFGVWSLFLTITALVEVARNGLIQNALVKFLAGLEDKQVIKETIAASLSLNLLLSFVSAAGLYLGGPYLEKLLNAPGLAELLAYYTLTTIVLVGFSQFNFVQQANLDFKGIFLSTFVRQGLTFIFIAATAVFGAKIEMLQLVWWQTFAAAAGALTSYIQARKYLILSIKVKAKKVRELFNFGFFVFGTNISATIFSSIDQFMLGALLTTTDVANYNAPLRITNLIDVPISTIVAVVFPKSAHMVATEGKDKLKDLYLKSVALMLCIVLPAVLFTVVAAEIIMYIIAGEEYVSTAGMILRFTVLYSLIQPFTRQFGTMMDSIGKPQLNFAVLVVVAVLNTVLNYAFISITGSIFGAIIGSMTALLCFFCIIAYFLNRELEINILHSLKFIPQHYATGWAYVKKKLNKG